VGYLSSGESVGKSLKKIVQYLIPHMHFVKKLVKLSEYFTDLKNFVSI